MQYEDILNKTIYGGWFGSDEVEQFLDYAGEVDLSEPDYSFDIIGFWVRKSDGQVLYATDAGCSCPAPWEDTRVMDLLETSADKIPDLVVRVGEDGYGSIPAATLRQDARAVQKRVRELGGK